MNEPFRIRHARPIVITTTLAILSLFGVIALVRYTRAKTAKNSYLIQADQAQLRGLRKSMDVKILGEPVGLVTDVRYRDDHPSHVEVEFTVDNPSKNKILANSRVVVARTMAVGAPYLEIERTTDFLGLIVRNLGFDEVTQSGNAGVRIVEIASGSPASLFEDRLLGKVITSLDDIPVEDVRSYYKLMNEIVPGSKVPLTLLGAAEPIVLDAELVMTHRTLTNGTVVQQFVPEENSVQTITEKLTLVQESIAEVEKSMVTSLTSTDGKVDKSVLPAFDSITKSSDAFREQTLVKANESIEKSKETLGNFDNTADTVTKRVSRVSKKVIDMVDESATPAFDSFNDAAESLETTSQRLRRTVDTVGEDTGKAIEKLTDAIVTLQEVLDKSRVVVDVLERESQDLPGTARRINGTMQNINGTVQKAQTTLDGINNHWLLRRSVKKAEAEKSGQAKTGGPLQKLFHR